MRSEVKCQGWGEEGPESQPWGEGSDRTYGQPLLKSRTARAPKQSWGWFLTLLAVGSATPKS